MSLNSICEQWEGRTVDGKFPLLEWVGGWADQCVFLTVRQAMQTANIKLISASGADADAYQAKWEAARTLSHPHLVKVMESGQCAVDGKDLVYVVTERADAVLSALIPRKALDPATVKAILEPIVDAIAFVHEKGFVHGRVKPPNIIRVGEQWKLSVEELIAPGETQRTAGEPGAYDAPEAATGTYTPASDVWSVGMIVIEAFAQRIPDAAPNGSRTVPDSLPEPFFEIARRCVRRDPAERCSIADVRAILARYEPQPRALEAPLRTPEPVAKLPAAEPILAEDGEKQRKEKMSASPVLPFEEAEPIELTPRSRLFANIEEEQTGRSRLGPIMFGIVILVGAAAVFGVREYRIRSLRAGDVLTSPAPSQPLSQTQAPAKPQADNQSTTPTAQNQSAAPAGEGTQSSAAPAPEQNQPQAATQQSTPTPAQANTPAATQPAAPQVPQQTTPAQPSAAEEKPQPQPKHEPTAAKAPGANADGAVLKRVLPNVAAGARESMQRPIEVELRVFVNERGSVSNSEYMTQGPGNYFARVAHDAAKSWKFTPPESAGQPRTSIWTLRFRFDRRNTQVTATQVR